jgi:hypothetical protein
LHQYHSMLIFLFFLTGVLCMLIASPCLSSQFSYWFCHVYVCLPQHCSFCYSSVVIYFLVFKVLQLWTPVSTAGISVAFSHGFSVTLNLWPPKRKEMHGQQTPMHKQQASLPLLRAWRLSTGQSGFCIKYTLSRPKMSSFKWFGRLSTNFASEETFYNKNMRSVFKKNPFVLKNDFGSMNSHFTVTNSDKQ